MALNCLRRLWSRKSEATSRGRSVPARRASFRPSLEPLEVRLVPAVLDLFRAALTTVTSTADHGPGSFRQAIQAANALPGRDTIRFQLGDNKRIQLTSELPALTDAVTIEGPGLGEGLLAVEGSGVGLTITADDCTVQGLCLTGFDDGIVVTSNHNLIQDNWINSHVVGLTLFGASDNRVLDNVFNQIVDQSWFGLSPSWGIRIKGEERSAQSNPVLLRAARGNVLEGNWIQVPDRLFAAGILSFSQDANDGILIGFGASETRIGGTTPKAGNHVVGEKHAGIRLFDGTSGNTIQGNYLAGNGTGVLVETGAANNRIGGTEAGAGNVIVDSHPKLVLDTISLVNALQGRAGGEGIVLQGKGTTGNLIQGNFIGTDSHDSAHIGNGASGVVIRHGAAFNTVGGTVAGARNVISYNKGAGVLIADQGSTGNAVQGNVIQSNGGSIFLGHGSGVDIRDGAAGNRIEAGNVISGNLGSGITLSGTGTTANVVQENLIGTAGDGVTAMGNGGAGVSVSAGASGNTVGGVVVPFGWILHPDGRLTGRPAVSKGNVIAFNGEAGVAVDASTATTISRNSIFANAGGGILLTHGGNSSQPAPVLTSVTPTGFAFSNNFAVTGTLNAWPNSTYTLEFFAGKRGYAGQGAVYLSSVLVKTDAEGRATFTISLQLPRGSGLTPRADLTGGGTVTATDALGNTSPFSNSLPFHRVGHWVAPYAPGHLPGSVR